MGERQHVASADRPGYESTRGREGPPRCVNQVKTHQSLQALFEEVVRSTPDTMAVVFGERSLTYAELNCRANQFARYLRDKGIGPDRLVALCLDRSLELVIAVMGVIKSGGAYLPLDPAYPPERLKYMLEDAEPAIVVTQSGWKGALSSPRTESIAIDDISATIRQLPDGNLSEVDTAVTGLNLVYVIYTSGSTGRPKGVSMAHHSMVNLIRWHRVTFGIHAGRRVLQFAALSFDVAFQEILSTLCTGGTLYMVSEGTRRDVQKLTELISTQRIETIFVPPLMLQSLAGYLNSSSVDYPARLRHIVAAGEQLRVSEEIRSLVRSMNGCELHNHYGPTESHVVMAHSLKGDPSHWPEFPLIGRPISNVQIYILDPHLRPVSDGTTGEIYIGGVAVARGYLGRPALTAQRFVADPFAETGINCMYRTGDLARRLKDGAVEYLGRNDHQVKIRGFRVELGEVEATLLKHPVVKGAVVVARDYGPGNKRLVAYFTSEDASLTCTGETLRSYLATTLPEHMVPSAFVLLREWPLTPNGKIDRQALPAPDSRVCSSVEFEAPVGEKEVLLARIWADLLGLERVGRSDRFFEIGGHSLLVVQLLDRLRKLGLHVEARHVFVSESLADLAGKITGSGPEVKVLAGEIHPSCNQITPDMIALVRLTQEQIDSIVESVPGGAGNIQDIYPLTPLQEGMLFHHLLDERNGDTYVLLTVLSVSSLARLEELISALQSVIDRHEMLRTAVLWEDLPRPIQVVYRHALLPVSKVALDPDRDADDQIRELSLPELQRMELQRAPLLRLKVAAHASSGRLYALLQMHHMIDDDQSLRIVIADVVAYLEGRGERVPPPVSYRQHVVEALAHSQVYDAETFFRQRLSDVAETTAPFGLSDVRGDGSRIREAIGGIDSSMAERVYAQSRRLNVSAATLFHAAWALVVSRTSGRDDVVFGTVLLGRLQGSMGAERIVGMFVNTLPLRLRLSDCTAIQLVEQTKNELVKVLLHEQASLAVAQRCSGIAGSMPLFSAVLNYRHDAVVPEAEWNRAAGLKLLRYQYRTNYPVGLSVDDLGNGFVLTAQSEQPVDPERVVAYLQTAIYSLVCALEHAPLKPALDLEVLPTSEWALVREGFNPPRVAYSNEQLIHEIFEAQVRQSPHSVAVEYQEQALTFEEVNRQANQLARYLRRRDVREGQLVGLCIDRSVDLIVGVLGVLKAGAAYVPLDPQYPAGRLASILEDASPRAIVATVASIDRLPKNIAPVVKIDLDRDLIAQEKLTNLDDEVSISPHHLAYVIYTSGSSGRPKGVMIEHRNVVSLWQGLERIYEQTRVPCRHVGVNASFNFDASVKQWIQLLSGRTIVIVPQGTRLDPNILVDFLERKRIDCIDCTPAQLNAWLSAGLLEHSGHRSQLVLVGGEAINRDLWRTLAGATNTAFYNVYGPTETAVDATYARILEQEVSPHIGKPLENRQVYVLDACGRALPADVCGEIYIGGPGVARGYVNRPDLTAERFIAHPYGEPGARLYRSGDIAAWRAGGRLEYRGRNDAQVKIRGHRIEVGEIEARLAQHSRVKEVAVIARNDECGEARLVAYVAADFSRRNADQGAPEASKSMVAQWHSVHEETYSGASDGPSFVGWDSSYTGQPIPEEEMNEWLDSTVNRIQSLGPLKVLEIGCGVGLLLQRLAPQCAVYVGTDFSSSALGRLQQWMSARQGFGHVRLLEREATKLEDLPANSFDTIILNSVIQYFPDIDYLVAVMRGAIRLLEPGGKIFLGDVRHLGLLPMFHASVQLSKAAATVSVRQLRQRTARSVAHEKELVIDPNFFEELRNHLPSITSVAVQLKQGRASNELTRYRYDVVLGVNEMSVRGAIREVIDWTPTEGTVAEIEAAMKELRWRAVCIRRIPNMRLAREAKALELLEIFDERADAAALRRQLNRMQFDALEPDQFWHLGRKHGYDVQISWNSDDAQGAFDLTMTHGSSAEQATKSVVATLGIAKALSFYANEPIEGIFRQQLIPELREYLQEWLPEYMLPSMWVALKQLPLTPSGKVDRRALPAPQGRGDEVGEYVSPSTEVERILADMWAQVLQIDKVGIKDNFFEIGGHSLLAMQVLVRVRTTLSVDMPLSVLFDSPTIQELAAYLESVRHAQLIDDIQNGGDEMEELLQRVAAMPESEVKDLVRKFSASAKQ